jgi:hypothetical protein
MIAPLNCDECKMQYRCTHISADCKYPEGRQYGVTTYDKIRADQRSALEKRLEEAERVIEWALDLRFKFEAYDAARLYRAKYPKGGGVMLFNDELCPVCEKHQLRPSAKIQGRMWCQQCGYPSIEMITMGRKLSSLSTRVLELGAALEKIRDHKHRVNGTACTNSEVNANKHMLSCATGARAGHDCCAAIAAEALEGESVNNHTSQWDAVFGALPDLPDCEE